MANKKVNVKPVNPIDKALIKASKNTTPMLGAVDWQQGLQWGAELEGRIEIRLEQLFELKRGVNAMLGEVFFVLKQHAHEQGFTVIDYVEERFPDLIISDQQIYNCIHAYKKAAGLVKKRAKISKDDKKAIGFKEYQKSISDDAKPMLPSDYEAIIEKLKKDLEKKANQIAKGMEQVCKKDEQIENLKLRAEHGDIDVPMDGEITNAESQVKILDAQLAKLMLSWQNMKPKNNKAKAVHKAFFIKMQELLDDLHNEVID